MICKICEDLLTFYDATVVRYTCAVHRLSLGLDGDFVTASERCDELRKDCCFVREMVESHMDLAHDKRRRVSDCFGCGTPAGASPAN
jgi:hypothetical protein